ncbi:MAG TPA: acyl-CoA dehydrogenase [Mycobacteriales bacterium]|nr:acyl-CoA dehydrogenase [Mycobacteriales bacterium]
MGIALSEDHLELARVTRSALSARQVLAAAHASLDGPADGRAVWQLARELGWLGLHIDERFGGQGAGPAELLVVLEELGRVVAPGAVLGTVTAAAVIAERGTDEQRERWLPDLTAGATAGAAVIDGVALGADLADVLVGTRGDDVVIVRNEPPVVVDTHRDVDSTRTVSRVDIGAAPVLDVLPDAAAALRRTARLFASAEAIGGMNAVTEMAVGYVKVREQFGKPVGTFMAVKHHCAGMLVDTELATSAVWDAGRGAASAEEAELVTAIAAATALPAYLRLARLNIQLHGGIAFTWEHVAHLYLRRALALAAAFGRPEALATQVVDLCRAGVERAAALTLPPEAETHREAARAFVAEHLALPEDERRVHVARSGYLVPHWPRPYGRAADAVEQIVIDEELAEVERPDLGLGGWVLPAVLQVSTPEQAERWMWPAVEGRTRWCQLFSEPGAGSDAAAVATRAVKVDGGWRVNGQKVWTSDAASCQWGLATLRTDTTVSKHAGITTMAIDMSAPGVTVRPLREITGDALFNEVFFDDVFVPDRDVVGEVNGGWAVAMSTLGFERVSIGGDVTSIPAHEVIPILDRHAPGDVALAGELGTLIAEAHALRMLNQRSAARLIQASKPGAEGVIAKLVGAEHQQRVTELGLRIAGVAALLGEEPRLVRDSFYTRCLTLAGGTSEILRTSIAERILGLPREK